MSGSMLPLLDLSWTDGPVVPSLGMEITRNCRGWDLDCRVDEQLSYLVLFQKNMDNTGDVWSCITLMQNLWTNILWSLPVNVFLERFEGSHTVNGIYFCLWWNYMLVNDTLSENTRNMIMPADFCCCIFLVFGEADILKTSLSRLLLGSK